MPRSKRILYRGMMGRYRLNFSWPAINQHSAVVITAAEFRQDLLDLNTLKPLGASPSDPRYWPKGRANLGAADVYVTNIGPHGDGREAGGVEFALHVNWWQWWKRLDVIVTISILDQIDEFIRF